MRVEGKNAAGGHDGTVFRVAADGARWTAEGAITFANARAALATAASLPLPASGIVACDGITGADSAGVAVLLAVKRRASAQGMSLAFAQAPAVLTTLATLYGVEDILTA